MVKDTEMGFWIEGCIRRSSTFLRRYWLYRLEMESRD